MKKLGTLTEKEIAELKRANGLLTDKAKQANFEIFWNKVKKRLKLPENYNFVIYPDYSIGASKRKTKHENN